MSKKVSEAGQVAVQKTKEVTDSARINSAILDEEKIINNIYYQIGKLYYAKHLFDYENDFSGMITSIKASETKIAEYRQQLQDIKGVVHCEKCGAEVPDNVIFCSACGTALPKQNMMANTQDMTRCNNCGAMVKKNMRFCTICGTPMLQSPQPPITANVTHITSSNQVLKNPGQGRRCPSCASEIPGEVAFCTECGIRL